RCFAALSWELKGNGKLLLVHFLATIIMSFLRFWCGWRIPITFPVTAMMMKRRMILRGEMTGEKVSPFRDPVGRRISRKVGRARVLPVEDLV
ncbi:hypothetical protein KJ032_26735, partial [Salmonella enterica subsp. enterica serovar Typhimurium]|nr:hypothetical protein [Salmonella enterica subsp. enterica serovar Typhimurium]